VMTMNCGWSYMRGSKYARCCGRNADTNGAVCNRSTRQNCKSVSAGRHLCVGMIGVWKCHGDHSIKEAMTEWCAIRCGVRCSGESC
jgi:hypothetical protein